MSGNRMLATDIKFDLQNDDGSPLQGFETKVISEVDRFDGKYQPDILKTWPSGAKKYHHQLAGISYQVTMTAAQLGGGFLTLAAKQHQEVALGNNIPAIRLQRKGRPKNLPVFTELYVGGIVSGATNSQTTGNAAATTDVTIEFEDMQ